MNLDKTTSKTSRGGLNMNQLAPGSESTINSLNQVASRAHGAVHGLMDAIASTTNPIQTLPASTANSRSDMVRSVGGGGGGLSKSNSAHRHFAARTLTHAALQKKASVQNHHPEHHTKHSHQAKHSQDRDHLEGDHDHDHRKHHGALKERKDIHPAKGNARKLSSVDKQNLKFAEQENPRSVKILHKGGKEQVASSYQLPKKVVQSLSRLEALPKQRTRRRTLGANNKNKEDVDLNRRPGRNPQFQVGDNSKANHNNNTSMSGINKATHSKATAQVQALKAQNSLIATDSHHNPYDYDMSTLAVVIRRGNKMRGGKSAKPKRFGRKEEEELLQELPLYQQLEYLSKSTRFTYAEIGYIHTMYKNLTVHSSRAGEMDRALFREVFINAFGITNDVMLDQVYQYFDADHEGSISFTEWVKHLSICLRGTLDEQIKYCYAIYDLNGDGAIGKIEVISLIQDSLQLTKDLDGEQYENIREVADMVMKKFDKYLTGLITKELFRDGIKADPLALQCLGHCLPSADRISSFMACISIDYMDFATNYSMPNNPSYTTEKDRQRAHVGMSPSATLQMYAKIQNSLKKRIKSTTAATSLLKKDHRRSSGTKYETLVNPKKSVFQWN